MFKNALQVAMVMGLLGSSLVQADGGLKPFQQKAKDNELGSDEVKTQEHEIAKWCGKDLAVTGDFSHYDQESNKGRGGALQQLLGGVVGTCKDATYKGPLMKSLTTVNLTFGGKGGGSPAPNLSFHGGVLTYAVNWENGDLSNEVQKFLKAQLDK